MANPDHLAILKQGVNEWNAWRLKNIETDFDLSYANLVNADLERAYLYRGNLIKANLSRANVSHADLSRSYIAEAVFEEADLSGSHFRGANLTVASFKGAIVEQGNFEGANLTQTLLAQAKLSGANLSQANLEAADLTGADLSEADLTSAKLSLATLDGANLTGARLLGAELTRATLRGATLPGATLYGANLTKADLTNANLTGANLVEAILVRSNLENADLTGARVYGVSAWDVRLAGTIQTGLVITGHGEAVTIDGLEVAQFVYLLLNNENIRRVIDTVTSKVVLILGRFTQPRKAVLDTLRTTLRAKGYSPVVFDFEKPTRRDLTETVQLLANLARFVIADVTEAKSIPQELSHIIPFMPSVPILPIVQEGHQEYAMFEHWKQFTSVLSMSTYRSADELIDNLQALVLQPITSWENSRDRSIELARQNEALMAEIQRLRQQITEQDAGPTDPPPGAR